MDNRSKMTIKIADEVAQAVTSYARANGLSQSAVVEAFLRHFMARSDLFQVPVSTGGDQ